MKLSLINPALCPPEPYFRYVFPEDGWVAKGTTHQGWILEAKLHLQANGLSEPPDLVQKMEEQLCMTLPPGWCNYDDPQRGRASTNLGWNDVLQGVQAFMRWLNTGTKVVEQREAERRALVCSRCYYNVNVGGCSGCQQLVAELTKGLKTKYDFALRACAVCKCVLKAKVHFPQAVLDRENVRLQEIYPEHCWLKKGGANYRG